MSSWKTQEKDFQLWHQCPLCSLGLQWHKTYILLILLNLYWFLAEKNWTSKNCLFRNINFFKEIGGFWWPFLNLVFNHLPFVAGILYILSPWIGFLLHESNCLLLEWGACSRGLIIVFVWSQLDGGKVEQKNNGISSRQNLMMP